MIPAARPRISSFESWLMQNLRPLLFICLALTIEGLTAIVQVNMPRPAKPEEPVAAVLEKTADPAVQNEEILKRLEQSPVLWIQLSIVGIGFLACLGLGLTHMASSDAQHWTRSLLMQFPVRPMPALRGLDIVALICVFMALASATGTLIVLLNGGTFDAPALMLLNLAIVAAVGSIVVALAVHLARHRAGGNHGSLGLWPFWKLSALTPPRSIAKDIGLGILAYVMTAWMLVVIILFNTALVEWFGKTPDQHELVRIIGQGQDPWVLLGISMSATLGAAFFEELFFRGMLYNVMRRHLGGAAGALLAAFIFSIAHGIWAQVLGLWFLGLVMTWLYDRTGRLVASMTFHFMNNFVALMAMLLSQRTP